MNAPPVRRLLLAWVALLVLLGLSCGSAYLHLGVLNPVANFGIALVKAGVVVVVFMHIGRGTPMLRIAGSAALVALALLVLISSTDFLMRPAGGEDARAAPTAKPR